MVAKKQTEEKPAKVLEVLSKEPEHFYHGLFHDLPIAPEEAPENVQEDFPSKEDIEFEDKDLSYLEELSKGKKLISPRTEHAWFLFMTLYCCEWTKHPINKGSDRRLFGIKPPIDFSFVDGCKFLTAYYQSRQRLISTEDVPSKPKVYQLLNKLDRHTHSLLKELEAENEQVDHIESGDADITEEEFFSGKEAMVKNRKYFRERWKDKPVQSFIRQDIIQAIRSLEKNLSKRTRKRLSVATVNRYLSVLGSCFSLAEVNGKVDKNPCRGMRLQKENNISDRIMSYEEQAQILNVVPLKYKAMLEFAVLTAMRSSSQRKLEWADVSFSKGTMKLRGVKDPRSPEGKDVVIQMMPEVAKLLHALPRRIDCPTVFYSFPKSFRLCKLFKEWTSEAGVKGLTWMRLRNTGISRMCEAGVAFNVVQSQAGHSSREMTERYNSPSGDYKKRELEKYQNSLPTGTTTAPRVMGN